jgi:hypothetical protein
MQYTRAASFTFLEIYNDAILKGEAFIRACAASLRAAQRALSRARRVRASGAFYFIIITKA